MRSQEETKSELEAALQQSDEQLAEELGELRDDVQKHGEAIFREHPELFDRITDRMAEIDIAAFVNNNPEVADDFQELLWTGLSAIVDQSPEIKESITESVVVEFEASDCPMTGYLRTDAEAGKITGGAGSAPDALLTITGPADDLVGILTSDTDPVGAFMGGNLEVDGGMAQATKLAPMMTDITNALDGI